MVMIRVASLPGAGCVMGIMLLILSGCSTANLNSPERRQDFKPLGGDVSIQQLQGEVLQTMDPLGRYQKHSAMEVTGTDVWESTIIRWLTPLDENTQQFHARLGLSRQQIEFTFLNGEKKGQTIGFDGKSYERTGTRKRHRKSASISLYLGPLQCYLEWHQTLMRHPALTLVGTTEINTIPYRVVYATQGPPTRDLAEYDQYLIYINTRTNRIDYVEFTLRKLSRSYRGVVHYRDYKQVQGMLMPFWIGIGSDLAGPDFDHYFVIDHIEFSGLD
ncbi:hypothetical protein HRM2_01440 [Desulforapulum autotrophicum HRM2]|uniref:Lipoprotein n=1 Tax=Desulforapulum autotrophicum (strain ATCC 43914 / DSM 3382 / VKM B-1955 / HRM2) TaxID=177437 RepID=C0QEE9_DESAH|nr:hypothetical protein [Desulforapulum autotrophicum]ACN13266.1 hypothetical protein HRM2_01440 [Desulforapulum autotrophicum HRM2]